MKTIRKNILIVFFCIIWMPLAGNTTAGLFDSDSLLELELIYNINKFKKDRGLKRDFHPAKLSYTTPDGKQVTLDVEIKVRGKLRRQMLNCVVPPFRIKFDKTKTNDTLFQDQDKLKLVSHCKNKPKYFEHYYLIEYLIYKTYNILTDFSFRVRLVKLTYTDSENKEEPFTKFSFFIEDAREMAKRNNGKAVEVKSIELNQANFDISTLASVFQYMIGNTDWSIRSGHNMQLVKSGDDLQYFPVPFDFDMAGLIDAHYARPYTELPIKSVRERLFQGYCKSEPQFYRTFSIFHKHKEEIISLYRDFPYLPDKLKKRCITYLNAFYQIISSPKLVKRYFIDNYRGRPKPLK